MHVIGSMLVSALEKRGGFSDYLPAAGAVGGGLAGLVANAAVQSQVNPLAQAARGEHPTPGTLGQAYLSSLLLPGVGTLGGALLGAGAKRMVQGDSNVEHDLDYQMARNPASYLTSLMPVRRHFQSKLIDNAEAAGLPKPPGRALWKGTGIGAIVGGGLGLGAGALAGATTPESFGTKVNNLGAALVGGGLGALGGAAYGGALGFGIGDLVDYIRRFGWNKQAHKALQEISAKRKAEREGQKEASAVGALLRAIMKNPTARAVGTDAAVGAGIGVPAGLGAKAVGLNGFEDKSWTHAGIKGGLTGAATGLVVGNGLNDYGRRVVDGAFDRRRAVARAAQAPPPSARPPLTQPALPTRKRV